MLKSTTPDLDRVENYLQRAVVIDEQFAQARVSLGKVLLRRERPAEAAVQLERAIELEPDYAQAHYQLGRALQRMKRPTEAQAALNKFKELNDAQKKGSEDRRRELVRRMTNILF
jgi:tetratricopeptide (TPR) repeat protein